MAAPIDGGPGQDGVDYYFSASGTTIDLTAGTASDGLGGTDRLASIENVIGSIAGGDMVTGSDASNAMWGLGGDDTLRGGLADDFLDGGANNTSSPGDTLDGGPGTDTCLNGETIVPNTCEATSGPVAFSSVLKAQKVAVAAFRQLGLGSGPKRQVSGMAAPARTAFQRRSRSSSE